MIVVEGNWAPAEYKPALYLGYIPNAHYQSLIPIPTTENVLAEVVYAVMLQLEQDNQAAASAQPSQSTSNSTCDQEQGKSTDQQPDSFGPVLQEKAAASAQPSQSTSNSTCDQEQGKST